MEVGGGVLTRVPAVSDGGLGLLLTVQSRRPARRGAAGLIAGAAYALIPARFRSNTTSLPNGAAESVFLTLGPDVLLSRRTRLDVLWTPAIARERRVGAPSAPTTSARMHHDLAAVALGLRWGAESSRVGSALRWHGSLTPRGLEETGAPSFQVMWRF
jgi:hypothetical protein